MVIDIGMVMDMAMLMYLVLAEYICYAASAEQVKRLATANTFTDIAISV